MINRKLKVFVAMSGGVDSSVAAALLKKDGFGVVGVYIKCWIPEDPLHNTCTSLDDERSARLAANHLGIPFYTWNFIKEYREKVVEYMLEGYKRGLTPNPDIMCNKEIKFGLFFEKAMRLGADFVATGHYARIENGKLFEAKDKNKDQSYFLSFIKPEVLSKILFPIGNYTKPEVRALAKSFGLPNADRKASRGVCFIGKLNFTEFLKKYVSLSPGPIVDTEGRFLGRHEGLAFYTIGQRKGIGLSGGPYYVLRKDFANNRLIVSKNEKDLYQKTLTFGNVNWLLSDPTEVLTELLQVRIRYRQPAVWARVLPVKDGVYQLSFEEPQRAITPGQFAVLYRKEQLLAGGIIK